MEDRFGRKINYLRLSVTDLCNLRCQYCMPESGVEKCLHSDILSFEEIDSIVSSLVDQGINKIRVTGGEPLVRKDIITLLKKIGRHEEVTDFALTTNGLLLKEMAQQIKDAGVDRVNVSLDSLDPKKYRKMTRGGDLTQVLEGIEEAIRVGLTPIKLNVVLIGGYNDDEIKDFVHLTKERPIDVRFIELMPIGEVATWSSKHFISNKMVTETATELELLENQEPNSPAIYYTLPGAKGRVGLISPISCKFCSDCNRIRLTSNGSLKYCLHSDDSINLKQILQRKGSIEAEVNRFLLQKPQKHNIEDGLFVNHNMVSIGG